MDKKGYRLIVLGLLILGMVLPVWANGESESKDDQIIIGGIMYDLSNKFHVYIEEGMRQFEAEHDDVTMYITDGKGDPNLQINQVETLITRGADAIVMVPVEPATLRQVIDKCEEADIELVIANLLPNEEDIDRIGAYVGSESIAAGLMQAEWVAEALGGEGEVAILIGDMGLEVARMRTQGNKDVFDRYPGITIVSELEGKWDRAKALAIAENWLTADINNKIDAIVCNNDEMAIGAYFASEQVGRDDLIIAGIDATPVALEYLGEGLDVTVFQSGNGQGYSSAEIAYKLAKGISVERMNWIPFELVTPDKKSEYLAKWQ